MDIQHPFQLWWMWCRRVEGCSVCDVALSDVLCIMIVVVGADGVRGYSRCNRRREESVVAEADQRIFHESAMLCYEGIPLPRSVRVT